MGSIIERPRKDGTIAWQVLVRPSGGRPIIKTFEDREIAELFSKSVEQDLVASKLKMALAARVKPKQPKSFALKIEDADELSLDPADAQRLLDNELLKETLNKYSKCSEVSAKSKAVIPVVMKTVGEVRVGELKKRWVRKYIEHMRTVPSQMGAPYAYSTIQGYLSVINCATRWRAEELDLQHRIIPFQKRTMIPADYSNERTRRLSHQEEIALFQSLRKVQGVSNRHYRLLTRFAIETGARLQEMVLAEWSEFREKPGVWIIPKSHVKTKRGREVPLTKRALRVLRALERMRDRSKNVIFHNLGKPASVSTVFARVVKKAGLIDFHFHDLRHEGISRMVMKQTGMSVFAIMGAVGHSSIAMLRRYANLRGEDLMGFLK